MASLSSPCSKPHHIVLFPFMAKGHTIPLLHLAQLLLHRGDTAVTIFTTPASHPFISQSLPGDDGVSIVDLPFPDHIQGVPEGAESTDKLPSMSLFLSFVRGVELMRPAFEQELEKIHHHVSCIISDGFLPWTLESASRFGIPLLSFFGMSYYASAVSREVGANGLMSIPESDDEAVALPGFPWIRITRNDFDDPFNKRDPSGPHWDFIIETVVATQNSFGLLVNTFYELEQVYADYCNRGQARTWSIGPLCLAKLQKNKPSPGEKPGWMHWLDQKLAQNSPVLYVAFGSQAKISPIQLREIALGLDEAEVSFLWVAKKSEMELLSDDGFRIKTSERGMVVTEWVDQEEILEHPIVKGFLSHCGWNSVLEGICAGVPILAWPMMAEQYLNAKMVVEEIKVGVRVSTVDGTSKGFVAAESLNRAVREVMDSEKGRQLREKVAEVAEAAKKAMREGGSSWNALNSLISEVQKQKEINKMNNSKLNSISP